MFPRQTSRLVVAFAIIGALVFSAFTQEALAKKKKNSQSTSKTKKTTKKTTKPRKTTSTSTRKSSTGTSSSSASALKTTEISGAVQKETVDDQGNVTAVSIKTDDEVVKIINSDKSKDLLKLVGQKVTVIGYKKKDSSGTLAMTVTKFEQAEQKAAGDEAKGAATTEEKPREGDAKTEEKPKEGGAKPADDAKTTKPADTAKDDE